MIEAPEALYLSQQLNKTIKGKLVTEVIMGYTPHKFAFLTDEPQNYILLLMNKRVDRAMARGDMVELTLGSTILAFTDGVNLLYHAPGDKLPAKHQFLIGFEDNSFLTGAIRMYGGILCFREGDFSASISSYYLMARNKPQLMSEDFTKEYFLAFINKEAEQKKSAKAFLTTGQKFPGLGNGVLQDILYNAGIHPKTKIHTLTDLQKEDLYEKVVSTLHEIYTQQGRNSETDLFGVKGRYVAHLSKDTAGKECPRCDSIIKKENYLGGSIYFCEGCQL